MVGPYLRDLRKLLDRHHLEAALYGHFGQGCIHCRISFKFDTEENIRNFRSFMEAAADLVVGYGGSLSGEHGDGQARGELLPRMFGAEMVQGFAEFKAIWDPDWKMNPGKKVRPNSMTQNLRLGLQYSPPQPRTHFHFPEDQDDFGKVTDRCVGVGECRRQTEGTMCPSFRVTHDEMHSTRGRARLLFEMMQGNPLEGGWKNETVREALDLCLACKGCKGDCPVHVDMATYKAEFLSHYYEGRLRPRHAYSMGLIYWWARLASVAPRLVNFVTHAPLLGDVARWMGGIAPERRMPPFAPEPFKEWFRRRGPRNQGGPPVLLWADTFNNYLHPRWRRRPLKCWRTPASRSRCRRRRSAAAGPCTTSACSTPRRDCSAKSSTRSATRSGPACRSSALSRAVPPSSATSCATCSRTTRTPGACATRPICSANSSTGRRSTTGCRSSGARPSCTATATTRQS
jgi:hypothetical protein